MKLRYFACFIFLLLCIHSSADVIDKEKASLYARQCLGQKAVAIQSPASGDTKSSVDPEYFIFNGEQGGWCIISGDDVATPVLAMNSEGSLDMDNLPPAMLSWLKNVSQNISIARSRHLSTTKSMKNSVIPSVTKVSSEKYLPTPRWAQGYPYNAKAEQVLGVKNIDTGCVATAMAEVLCYNKWPEKGSGVIPAYTTQTMKYAVPATDIDGYSYQWTNMPTYPCSVTQMWNAEQIKAVSELMFHCGAMVQMDYTSEGSGAFSSDIIPALAKYMSYYKGARYLYRMSYTNSEWFSMIKDEIDANRPLLYGGADIEKNDAHAFVCDGYNSNNQVHINWGWEGFANGWYAVCYIGGQNGVDYVFNYYDGAIFTLTPDAQSTGQSTPMVFLTSMPDCGLSGIVPVSESRTSIPQGVQFALKVGAIMMYDMTQDYNGTIRMALLNRYGELKDWLTSESEIQIKMTSEGYRSFYFKNISCMTDKPLELGDYCALYMSVADGSLKRVGGTYDPRIQPDPYVIDRMGVYNVTLLNLPDNLISGQTIYPELIYGWRLPQEIVWYYDGKVNDKGYIVLSPGNHEVKAKITYVDGGSETLFKVIKVNK